MRSARTEGVVIIGAGLAALRCATTLRTAGHTGPITLIGDEPDLPYERPALSKELLSGARKADELAITTRGRLEELEITVLAGATATSIDASEQTVTMDDGTALPWDKLIFATGSRARELPNFRSYENVVTLRTLNDALQLQQLFEAGARKLAILGCGFVGAEVASTARKLGIDVTIVEPAAVPFERTLGYEVGSILAHEYAGAGIDLRCGVTAESGIETSANPARLAALDLSDGARLDCDAVLISVGAIPNDELFHSTWPDERPGQGIPVNKLGETPVANVFACGDVARVPHSHIPGGVRLEHWTDAAASAVRVANRIAGLPAESASVPYVWSDQLGHRIQIAGTTHSAEQTELVDESPQSLHAIYKDADGVVVAQLGINRPRDVARWRKELIQQHPAA